MNSNNAVEQGAGLVICSAERAASSGVPRDRWVFLHSGADAHDTDFVSNRVDLHSSPAIGAVGRHVLGHAGIGVDDVAHVDLYSCFPSAVQVAAAEIGLGLERQLTVTGGMSFAGGPWNNYVTHAIATMADVLRSDPGSRGLVTANGGFLTKHAAGIYSTEPPPSGAFRSAEPQEEVDAAGGRELAETIRGPGRDRGVHGDARPRRLTVQRPDRRCSHPTEGEPGPRSPIRDGARGDDPRGARSVGACALAAGGRIELEG